MRSRELTATALILIRRPAGIIGIIALMALGTACNGNDGISIEDLTGTWRVKEEGSYAEFNADGTYSIAWTIEGLENSPVEEGLYTIEGTLLTLISSDESKSCASGSRGFYEIERTGEGGMRHVIQEDECGIRGSTGTVNLERVP